MPYKRRQGSKRDKKSKLAETFAIYGMINEEVDQDWIIESLEELHQDGHFALSQFSQVVEDIKKMDLKDFKDEVASAKKVEKILQGKRALMTFLKKHIEKYRSEFNGAKAAILRVTEPDNHSDPTKALLAELKAQEIRNVIRSLEPKLRRDFVAGNLDRIKAIINAPDNIIEPLALLNIRREFAFDTDPSLVNLERDAQTIYQSIRKRAAEINSTAVKMLINERMDDPLPPAEHFEVFIPETDLEKVYATKRIQAYNRSKDAAERKKQFDESHPGTNMGGSKKVSINRGASA